MSDQPAQQAPPVQKLRLRYAKRGRLRFTSHRDFSRAFERAVRRARVPTAYSSGYHPHPRISYANAAPTGAQSVSEYLEIALAQRSDPEDVRQALDDVLPTGLDVLECVEATPGALADRLQASHWRIELSGVALPSVQRAVEQFLAEGSIEVERMTKKGLRTFDCRAAVASLSAAEASLSAAGTSDPVAECAILDVVLRHGTPSVRPDDVLAGLREVSGLAPGVSLHTRVAQGLLDERTGTVSDPLARDRDAADRQSATAAGPQSLASTLGAEDVDAPREP